MGCTLLQWKREPLQANLKHGGWLKRPHTSRTQTFDVDSSRDVNTRSCITNILQSEEKQNRIA